MTLSSHVEKMNTPHDPVDCGTIFSSSICMTFCRTSVTITIWILFFFSHSFEDFLAIVGPVGWLSFSQAHI